MKKLAIIGGGYMAGIYADNAHEMGLNTVAFSLKAGFADVSKFDQVYDIDIMDKNAVLNICRELSIDGVVSTTELTIATAAYVADNLGLINIPYKNAVEITNKYRNRRISSSVKGLKHPRFALVNSINEIVELHFDYPIILKPTSKGGKRGVVVVESISDIENAFSYALKDSGSTLPLIVEEYIDADMECSVESLSYQGDNYIVQITEKVTSGPPHCVELAHHQPANIPDNLRQKIESIISDGLNAIGLINGPCHTEIRIKNDEIYLIEFNARPGGDHIAYPLTDLSTGYSYIKGAISIAINSFVPPEINMNNSKYSGVLFVTQQTKQWKSIFDNCEKQEWFFSKHSASEELLSITHNNGFNLNYFIYCSDKRPDFLDV